MSKAEERALEAYPVIMGEFIPADDKHKAIKQDCNMFVRKAFIKGYKQAEKDLALSWLDVRLINNIYERMASQFEWQQVPIEQFYTEVLKRFLESKNV